MWRWHRWNTDEINCGGSPQRLNLWPKKSTDCPLNPKQLLMPEILWWCCWSEWWGADRAGRTRQTWEVDALLGVCLAPSRSQTVQPCWDLLTERFTGGLGRSGSSHFYQAGPDPRPWPLASFNSLRADEASHSLQPTRLQTPEGRTVRCVLCGRRWRLVHVSVAWRGVFSPACPVVLWALAEVTGCDFDG